MTHRGQPYTPIDRWPDFSTYKHRLQVPGEVAQIYQTINASVTIQDTSNTTPIVVTTDEPNKFETGDQVFIFDTGDSGADNGNPHTITVIDAMSFSLNGSTASGGSSGPGVAVEAKAGNVAALIDAVTFLGKRLVGEQSLSYASTIDIDWSLGATVDIAALTGNPTITSSNPITGQTVSIYVVQDGTGGRTITWPAAFQFGVYDLAPSPSPGAVTIWTFRWHGSLSRMVCTGRNFYVEV